MNLLQLREDAGLTQEQLAERTNLDQTTISQLERGRIKDPRMSTVTALATVYQRTSEEVLAALAESISSAEQLAS